MKNGVDNRAKTLGIMLRITGFCFFYSLTAANAVQLDFLKINHYCDGFERKMRRVGSIPTKLSLHKDFDEWTF